VTPQLAAIVVGGPTTHGSLDPVSLSSHFILLFKEAPGKKKTSNVALPNPPRGISPAHHSPFHTTSHKLVPKTLQQTHGWKDRRPKTTDFLGTVHT
ncbi:hypothetical protein LZD48_18545, partial [Oceanobacillus sp. APA_J-2(6-2)]|nr:hypothetical protein [Oceanobacillus alkalisoli]